MTLSDFGIEPDGLYLRFLADGAKLLARLGPKKLAKLLLSSTSLAVRWQLLMRRAYEQLTQKPVFHLNLDSLSPELVEEMTAIASAKMVEYLERL